MCPNALVDVRDQISPRPQARLNKAHKTRCIRGLPFWSSGKRWCVVVRRMGCNGFRIGKKLIRDGDDLERVKKGQNTLLATFDLTAKTVPTPTAA